MVACCNWNRANIGQRRGTKNRVSKLLSHLWWWLLKHRHINEKEWSNVCQDFCLELKSDIFSWDGFQMSFQNTWTKNQEICAIALLSLFRCSYFILLWILFSKPIWTFWEKAVVADSLHIVWQILYSLWHCALFAHCRSFVFEHLWTLSIILYWIQHRV